MSAGAIKRLHLVYFSPSGSTEKIVRRVASGITGLPVEAHDLLTPASRRKEYAFGKEDLVIFGSMTARKLFTLSEELFGCLKADGTPFIGAVSYGNSYYGIALTELKRRAEGQGFRVAALGAFAARHSIDPSVGAGRPDAQDEAIMADFGRRAYEKILGGDGELHNVPGTNWSSLEQANKLIAYREEHPDEPYALPPSYKAKAISDACVKCGNCVRHCPVDAIDIEARTFDLDRCIGCWGCVNRCPKRAITSTSAEMAEVMKQAAGAFQVRREPEVFL